MALTFQPRTQAPSILHVTTYRTIWPPSVLESVNYFYLFDKAKTIDYRMLWEHCQTVERWFEACKTSNN